MLDLSSAREKHYEVKWNIPQVMQKIYVKPLHIYF
jgi:hypothetical protein